MCSSLFLCIPVNGHLGFSHLGVLLNKAALSILIHVFLMDSFSLCYVGVAFGGSREGVCLATESYCNVCQVSVPFLCVRISVTLQPQQRLMLYVGITQNHVLVLIYTSE